ncbi:exocyst complex component Sec6p [[Candida] jaroonii]|uniref:Exocyst complex component Sec6p n=1 Tax=[Candida] jaroonii TaxID=467808 RepID=A0ACA9YAQ4_9ASCO|nr:exocyst complex component Sec6p [[Candida] jaroonii]
MSEGALNRISNLISIEDDLNKISQLRTQFLKEKSTIDSKLNNVTKLQIDSIISNLNKLNTSSEKLTTIKSEINKVNSIHGDSVLIEGYEDVMKMTKVNQYFNQVNHLVDDITNFRRNLDNINALIDNELDIITNDITYPLSNMLKIHYNLTQVRNFQDYLETYSQSLSDDMKSIIIRILSPLRKTIKLFDDLLKEIIISLTEAVKEGNLQLVLKLIKIIDYETNEDLKVLLKNNLDLKENVLTVNYGMKRLVKRNYKKFFYDKLEESLIETFDLCINHYSQDRMLVYDNLEWLEDEILFVNDTLSLLFPESWEINNFIQNVYYNKLHNFTMDIIKTDPPAEDLLRILSYDTHYNKFLLALQTVETSDKRKSVIKPQNKSIIGEDLKNVVLDDYLKVILQKMEEWNENLIQTETRTFNQREGPPDLYNYHQVIDDEDINDQPVMLDIETNVYVLPDFKTPLTMLKEQADVAADSGYGKILVGVIEHWSHCYIKRIVNYQEIIDEEFDNYMSIYNNERFLINESKTRRLFRRRQKDIVNLDEMTQEQLSAISKEGLIEYLAALGNTFEINTDRLQDRFLPTYKEKVHSNYQLKIEQAFEDTVTPSTELNAQVIRAIVDIIINDLYPALSKLFTKSWYEDNQSQFSDVQPMAARIVETIGEYMEEFRGYTTYDIYSVTFNVLLDSFISSYIRIGYENILHGDGKKIDPSNTKKFKSFNDAIGRDVTILYGGLESLFTRKDSGYLLNSLRAIEFLSDLATCEQPMEFIPQMWENEILGSFYYCSVEYIRGICLCRKDMDKNEVNLLINSLIKIQKTYHQQVQPPLMVTGTLNDFTFN